jgi:hypothetical protein
LFCKSFSFFPNHLNVSVPLDAAGKDESVVVGVMLTFEFPHLADQDLAVR